MIRRLILIAALIVPALPAVAQDDADDTPSLDDIPHITMLGTARTEVAPDLAVITLGVTTQKPTAKAAADENAKTATAVVAAAKASGVGSADIATQSVTLTQQYEDVQDGSNHYTRKPKGFEAGNTISVRARDLAKAGTLAQALIDKGANRFDGISFIVEHPEPILARLTGEAVKNAKELASISAQAAGVMLGRVLQISRPGGNGGGSPPVFAARAKMAAAPAAPMPVEGGSSELSAEMVVTWAIAPK